MHFWGRDAFPIFFFLLGGETFGKGKHNERNVIHSYWVFTYINEGKVKTKDCYQWNTWFLSYVIAVVRQILFVQFVYVASGLVINSVAR